MVGRYVQHFNNVTMFIDIDQTLSLPANTTPSNHSLMWLLVCSAVCHSAQCPAGTSRYVNFGQAFPMIFAMSGVKTISLSAWMKRVGC